MRLRLPMPTLQASVGNLQREYEAISYSSEGAQGGADIPATEVSVRPIKKLPKRAREPKGKPRGIFLFTIKQSTRI